MGRQRAAWIVRPRQGHQSQSRTPPARGRRLQERHQMFRKMIFSAVSILAMATSMAHAADMKEFRVGILGGENETDRLRNYQCLADHLKAEFGFEKVSLFPAADYDGVIQ